jgi:hypothetical protein
VREKMEIGNNACDFEMFCEKLSWEDLDLDG